MQTEFSFDGDTIVPPRDNPRLAKQLLKVRDLMLDGAWRTLSEIARITEAPEASISARLRDLRKDRNGGYEVEREYVSNGLFLYRIKL